LSLTPPHTPELGEQDLELVRLEHERKIVELQKQPLVAARVLRDVSLGDGITTPVAHGMGRPVAVFVSAPRGAVTSGRIEEVRAGGFDRAKYVVLKASGFGGSVTADLVVI
jgi:hypothetical protein